MIDPITVNNISVSYDDNEVVKDVSFSFGPGSLIGVLDQTAQENQHY